MPKTSGVSSKVSPEDFLEFLVARGALQQERADRIRTSMLKTHRPATVILSESGAIPEEDVYRFRADFLNVPFESMSPEAKIAPELFRIIPEEAARRYQMAPLYLDGKILRVGMLEPDDLAAQNALRFIATREGIRAEIVLVTGSAFQNILNQYRPYRGEVEAALSELEYTLSEPTKGEKASEAKRQRSEELLVEAPIIKMVAVVLRQAVEGNASDIHIEPGSAQMRIRFRVDGVLHTSLFLPMSVHPAMIARFKILATLKIDETRLAQDGRFRTTIDGKMIDFRVATFPTALGEKIAIRLLDPTMALQSLTEHGLVGQSLKAMEDAIGRPFGIVLITGPTGSGKTTTLYTILQQIPRDDENIMTLEDPVEYSIEGVNQSQVNEEIGYTFASGLRHILRGDPNIIMVGEIRDVETAKLAVHSGLTGHLVLSTLHTNNAIGVVPRLLNLGVDAFLIPPTLLIAVAQRLVQTLCSECKKPRDPLLKEREIIMSAFENLPESDLATFPKEIRVWEAQGCDQCGGSGTKGRTAVFETLRMTRELGEIILTSPSEARILDEARRQKMITMFQDGIRKVLHGIISLQELLRVVEEKEEIEE